MILFHQKSKWYYQKILKAYMKATISFFCVIRGYDITVQGFFSIKSTKVHRVPFKYIFQQSHLTSDKGVAFLETDFFWSISHFNESWIDDTTLTLFDKWEGGCTKKWLKNIIFLVVISIISFEYFQYFWRICALYSLYSFLRIL